MDTCIKLAGVIVTTMLFCGGCATEGKDLATKPQSTNEKYNSCLEILAEMQRRGIGPGDLGSVFPDPREKDRIPQLGSHRDNLLRELWYRKRCST
jgi:hypothetical protein